MYDCVDFLPHMPGKLFKRGGWTLLTSVTGAAGRSIGYLDLSTPEVLFVVSGGTPGPGTLYKHVSGVTTQVSTGALIPVQEMITLLSGTTLVAILTSSDGSAAPQKYVSPSTLATVGGSPPTAKYAVAYKDRLWVAGGSANPQRIFASGLGTVDTWDTTLDWIDVEEPVTGLAALPNAILVFSKDFSWRITGSTPGASPDLDRQPLGNIGCTDARAITYWQGNVIVCNPEGVFMSGGGAWANLTQRGGIDSYWHSLFSGYNLSTWVVSAGTFRTFLFVTILNNTLAEVATLCCYLPTLSWFRLTNMSALMYARGIGAQTELYFIRNTNARVAKASSLVNPQASNKADGDGTNVTCSLQTRLLFPGAQLQHYTDGWLLYDLRDAAADNPTLTVQVAPGLSPSTFSAVPESPLAETTSPARKRLTLSAVSESLSVKVSQSGPSALTELYALMADVRILLAQAER